MYKKLLGFFGLMLSITVVLLEKDTLLDIIKEGTMRSIILSILFIAIVSHFPIIPFFLAVGIMGAIFGLLKGTLISLIGVIIGVLAVFFLTRYSFRDLISKKVKNSPTTRKYEDYFAKNAFTSILFFGGILPLLPSLFTSSLCGLSSVRWTVFFLASLVGQIPRVFVITTAGVYFPTNKLMSLSIYVGYIAVTLSMSFRKFPNLFRIPKGTDRGIMKMINKRIK
ncbi:TVP38/TMEM64 family protein [Priestia filamentosa]|uniref:TVP38/TMEM64 family membrane protein n=1 Tax=Priestia filamentosa TaxID=1402861 RepID=A0A1X7EHP8_9BACI|nr:VTT domain-containing protein [Priestia filamentosa]AKO92899.1 hypothetical protein BEH_12865 [Priestia filamentosa]MDT3763024.1 VTT domain-containing protein [Priestia filamentosa]OXS69542.1 TVP38/TMEM64 family protein [Priestia filamentosa]WCM14048.1 VTT domain-containing protein [Priestia filamentosa]WRU97462.1 VTT domain-containing protein [Priestia filamentosa]